MYSDGLLDCAQKQNNIAHKKEFYGGYDSYFKAFENKECFHNALEVAEQEGFPQI